MPLGLPFCGVAISITCSDLACARFYMISSRNLRILVGELAQDCYKCVATDVEVVLEVESSTRPAASEAPLVASAT